MNSDLEKKQLLPHNEQFITGVILSTLFNYDDCVYPITKLLIDFQIVTWNKKCNLNEGYKWVDFNFWLECFPGEEGKDTPVFEYSIRYSNTTTILEFSNMVFELCKVIEERGKDE